MAVKVNTVLENIERAIADPKTDVTRRRRWIVAVGDPDNHNNDLDNFYVIGVMQNFNTGSGRPIIEHNEIGSDYTITSIGLTAHSGRIDRMKVKGGSALYALHYPRCILGSPMYRSVSSLLSNYEAESPSIDGQSYGPNDLVGGTDIILGVADISPDTEFVEPHEIRAIAVVQGINLTSNAMIMNVPEIGTNDTYIISSKGDKSMFFSRIMARGENVLYEIYKKIIQEKGYNESQYRTEFCDLSMTAYRHGVTLALTVRDPDLSVSTSPQDIILLTEAIPSQWGSSKEAGARVRPENVGWSWQKTKYLSVGSNQPRNAAPGDLKNSNLWIDLDREFIRQPIDMLLISEPQDELESDLGTTPTGMVLVKDAMIESIARSYTAQNTNTVEGLTLRWSTIQRWSGY